MPHHIDADGVTPRERALVHHYLESGNLTHSGLKAYNTDSPKVASSMASAVMNRQRVQKYIRLLGIRKHASPEKALERIGSALEAKRTVANKDGLPLELGPDWNAQLKAADLILKVHGLMDSGRNGQNGNASPVISLDGQPPAVAAWIVSTGRMPSPEERAKLLDGCKQA